MLTIIVPAFNESSLIVKTLGRVVGIGPQVKIVLIDDGSSDCTWSEMVLSVGCNSNVVAIKHANNEGKGVAIRTGLCAHSTALVTVQDADLEYNPEDYEQMLESMERNRASIVYGSRFLKSELFRDGLRWHTLGNRLLTWFSNLVTGQSITDEATCYKLFRREVLERMNLQEDGFGFCPEVTAKASRLGIKIYEVPISYHPRTKAEGKKIRLWHGFEALWCLVYYTWFDRSLEPGARRKPHAAQPQSVQAQSAQPRLVQPQPVQAQPAQPQPVQPQPAQTQPPNDPPANP